MKKNTKSLHLRKSRWLLLFVLISFFHTNNTFSQTQNENTENKLLVQKILSIDGRDAIFSQLIENTLKEIDVKNQAIYKNKLESIARQIKREAIDFLAQKYSRQDLENIYSETLNYNRSNRSAVFDDFYKYWTMYKQKFYQAFQKIYKQFKK